MPSTPEPPTPSPDNKILLTDFLQHHGVNNVQLSDFLDRSIIAFHIKPHDEIAWTCVKLELYIASAARNASSALRVIDRMKQLTNLQDCDLLTALRKYVEDTCEAIKVIDNTLKNNGAELQDLIYEIPGHTVEETASWRNLIGRRDVIAHNLLTIDNNRVHNEAVRDFGNLHQLLSKASFVPVKTDWSRNQGFPVRIKADVFRSLEPSNSGEIPKVGQSLILICEDRFEGFIAFRLGRTHDNKILLGSSHAPLSMSLSVSYETQK